MSVVGNGRGPVLETSPPAPNPLEPEAALFGDLRSLPGGLSQRGAERRLLQYGANEITRRGRRRVWREIVRQLTHPLALLLWAAAVLAWFAGTPFLSGAIVAVVLLNAVFALFQERQAERAVEALAAFLPEQVAVLRDGRRRLADVRELVATPLAAPLGMALPPLDALLLLLFPLIVWGADELWRGRRRPR
jgi:hypothetical protein